jgi:serine/threonine protein kinase/tetratricopeptide (TPR) repeat protein
MSILEPERALLHYRIVQKIGHGGMGEVYKALDTKLGRHVAIKLLPAEAIADLIAKRRLLVEAQAASALNHPNIVTIHSIEESDGLDFIVMEFVEGETLKASIERNGALPLPTLLDLGIQIADAVEAAHEIGIIHRDIKSSNILITPKGHAKVLDFGLAKLVRQFRDEVDKEAPTLADLTYSGAVVGTASYMSPEQTRGEVLDPRTDVFSLGCVLYEAATRSLPFPGPSLLAIMHAIATSDPQPPSRVRPELPIEFDLITERALTKDRERRYATAAEMGQALRSLRASVGTGWVGSPVIYDSDLLGAASSSLVGREPEMRKLDGFLRQAIDGSGRVVFITGEPGIGKTSLSDEFLRRARRENSALLISRGRCVEQYGTGEAYLPFLDAVGGLLQGPGREHIAAVMRTYAPTWCTQLPAAFVSTSSLDRLQQETIGATKERMMREMGDMLGTLSTTAPIVLLLEDLHWADPSSVDLLGHLSQRINSQRLLIAGTFRPEDIERSNHPLKSYKAEMQAHKLCEELALDTLSLEHIAEYLDATFAPNDFPSELSSLIHEKTEGHPLFATNLLQYLSERGDIARVNSHWSLVRPLAEMHLEVPESVRSMIGKKIDALAEEEQRALQYASIEGSEFLSSVVARLLGTDEIELEERLAHLEKTHRLIVTLGEEELPDGTLATSYRFAHALYQNYLYDGLVSKRRILLHLQAGEQLAGHYGKRSLEIATQLAIHFERGRDFVRAVEYLTHAGDNATKLYAYNEAEQHYSNALRLAEKLPQAVQPEKLFTLHEKRGTVNRALSRFSQSADDYTEMRKHAVALGSLEQEAAALNALALTLFFAHRVKEMEACAAEAMQMAERAGSDVLRLETMGLVGLKHLCYGELREAKPILDEVVKTARAKNQKPALLTALTWRGGLHFFQTEYEEAIKLETEAKRLASELRDGFLLLTAWFFLGLAQGNQGRMSDALTTLNDAIVKARRNGDLFWGPRMPNCIGWIHRELQNFPAALKYDQEGCEVGREQHVLEAEANSLINLGIDYTHASETGKTESAFHEVHDIFKRDAWFRWRYNIRLQAATAEHWLAQGDLAKARQFALSLHETALENEAHKYVAVAHTLLGKIAIAKGDLAESEKIAEDNLAEAEKEFATALEEVRRYPAPLVAWKTYAEVGRLQLRMSNAASAREAFAQAAEIINYIANNTRDETLRSTFFNSSAVQEVIKASAKTVGEGG